MLRRITLLVGAILFSAAGLLAQAPQVRTSADIYESIKKLNVLGSALYIAAHPDDENTRMISYLANEQLVEATYLSLTRGDGGQNLIGPEIAELLGVIRTEELLAARRVDGGHQWFSRANDFGYSKHPDETLRIWNKQEVLADVVWAIRSIQPDVIINRFDYNSAGQTHGHHTSSAILSMEAFDLAGDPNAFPEQLKYVEPWQPKRLYYNTSWWQYGSMENFEKVDKSKFVTVDAGVFLPARGKSNGEIAAESRSMHKCQGMGSTPSRGSSLEYFEPLKGSLPADNDDLFSGIDIGWSRLQGGEKVKALVDKAIQTFQYDDPTASLPILLDIYQAIQALPDSHWKTHKVEEVHEVIEACMGLFLEATASDFSAAPGQSVDLKMELISRSGIETKLISLDFLPANGDTLVQVQLQPNAPLTFNRKVTIPDNAHYTSPYWLNGAHPLGMYDVEDQALRGKPETPRLLRVRFNLEVQGVPVSWTKDVVYKSTDRVKGEVYRPFEVLPPVFAKIKDPVYVFGDNAPKVVQIVVKAGKANVSGTVLPVIPEGWKVEPKEQAYSLPLKDQEQTLEFRLFPPEVQSEGWMKVIANCEGQAYRQELVRISYDHIPEQSVLLQAQARLARIDLKKAGERIGYIMGAGDEVPASLEAIGYQVDLLDPNEVDANRLRGYDAVVMGIRAYNTIERIRFIQPALLSYVEQGGTLIVQFNTTRGLALPMEEIAPYPLNLSHDRITVEEAPITFLRPDHPVLNFPNAITQKDFEGWVQERGLYYPDKWDDKYEAILSSQDPGEAPTSGGLLIAHYGKGHYIYTGMAWFRQLPAGVPGAYRIFANMLSLGKSGT
ncbi:MAG: PIG-L family deacetylase [Lewinellaceae bacterium]|nr:PIG-L family deacetylase [Lewinellaceae bacterium]